MLAFWEQPSSCGLITRVMMMMWLAEGVASRIQQHGNPSLGSGGSNVAGMMRQVPTLNARTRHETRSYSIT